MCCSVVPILFGWFLRVPFLHVHVFIRKTFLWLVSVIYFFNCFLEIVREERREVVGEAEGKMHGL